MKPTLISEFNANKSSGQSSHIILGFEEFLGSRTWNFVI